MNFDNKGDEQVNPEEPKKSNRKLILFILLALLGILIGFLIFSLAGKTKKKVPPPPKKPPQKKAKVYDHCKDY
jgi:flagellar basal body-associated protein FliL